MEHLTLTHTLRPPLKFPLNSPKSSQVSTHQSAWNLVVTSFITSNIVHFYSPPRDSQAFIFSTCTFLIFHNIPTRSCWSHLWSTLITFSLHVSHRPPLWALLHICFHLTRFQLVYSFHFPSFVCSCLPHPLMMWPPGQWITSRSIPLPHCTSVHLSRLEGMKREEKTLHTGCGWWQACTGLRLKHRREVPNLLQTENVPL